MEDWNIYTNVCSERFNKLEEKVDDLHATVKNGLSSKVADLWKMAKWLGVLLFGTLATVIVNLVLNHT